MALTTTCDITHPEQYKLSETKISTFSKGLQENLVNPTSDFVMIYVNTLQSFFSVYSLLNNWNLNKCFP